MDLILWRHGEAKEGSGPIADADRELTAGGLRHAQQMAEWLRQQIGIGFGLAFLDPGQQRADMVAALEQGRDHVAADLDLAVAQTVEHVLQDMGELLHGVEFDDAGAALDGVRGAEHGIDGLGIAVALFEPHQPGLHGFELFPGFDTKYAE